MTKTRKWRGLHSNVDLTNQKSFVLIFSQEKKNKRKTIKMLFPLDQSHLQSNQVKRTPQEYINEFIIQKLNLLLVVDFRLISAFLYV